MTYLFDKQTTGTGGQFDASSSDGYDSPNREHAVDFTEKHFPSPFWRLGALH